MRIFAGLTLSFLAVLCQPALAAPSSQLKVPMLIDAPTIDGKVTAEEQSNAAGANLQKVASLDDPRFETKVFLGATMEGLYVAFIASEPDTAGLPASTTGENGPVFNDDSLQILLTPTLDTAADSYYHFAVNAQGVKYSSHIIEREAVAGWQVAVSPAGDNVNSKTWQAEFFIPLKSIGAPDELPVWRANFARFRPARGEEQAETSAWIDPGISLHNFRKFGYLSMPRFVPAAPGGGNSETTSTAVRPAPAAQVNRVQNSAAITTMPVSVPVIP